MCCACHSAVTTPHRVSFFYNPAYALRTLLTPEERSSPSAFFKGIRPFAEVVILRAALIHLLMRPYLQAFDYRPLNSASEWKRLTVGAAFLIGTIPAALVLAPIEVAAARLSVIYPIQEKKECEDTTSVPRSFKYAIYCV